MNREDVSAWETPPRGGPKPLGFLSMKINRWLPAAACAAGASAVHAQDRHAPAGNLRTRGQLGLTGEWAVRKIHVGGRPFVEGDTAYTNDITPDKKFNPGSSPVRREGRYLPITGAMVREGRKKIE